MSPMPVQRPILIPGLPRIWRDARTLQLGSDPARAVLVELPDRDAADLLDLIDGTRPERALIRHAARSGIPAPEAEALLSTLHEAGLVVPAPALLPALLPESERHRLLGEASALAHHGGPAPARALRRRAAARVRITGEGRLGAGIAVALAESGVGHVDLDLPGTVTAEELPGGPLRVTDVGAERGTAVTSALLRAAPKIGTRPVRRATTLVIQLRHRQPVALLAASLARRHQPHLAVAIREGVAVIGPFVPAAGRPCLQCLDLHRRDRDPGWSDPIPAFEPCTVAALLAATAYATAEALTFIDGGTPETTGASAEMTTPGRIRRKTWPPHPACPCAQW
ncbi:hypothetical protein AB0M20_31735 [Actinoplanes sp. NPDC051633]|uniref:hypothetical protein n=1 Tax=Actinoplanes sp. NPDC051633 TaxID=3155670 RepID=UPI00342263D1